MDVELKPGDDWRTTAARMRGAPKEIRAALNKATKEATAPLERKLKTAVLGLDSSARRGGGSAARRAHNTTATGRLPKHTGLRANIARGITRKITYAGSTTGVRMRADGKRLPPSQRTLVRATNRGKVRHPFMGNREVWIDQKFTPARWFDNTLKIYGPAAVRKIDDAARQALQKLQ